MNSYINPPAMFCVKEMAVYSVVGFMTNSPVHCDCSKNQNKLCLNLRVPNALQFRKKKNVFRNCLNCPEIMKDSVGNQVNIVYMVTASTVLSQYTRAAERRPWSSL